MLFGRYTCVVQWHIVLSGGPWPNMQLQIAVATWRITTTSYSAFYQITLVFVLNGNALCFLKATTVVSNWAWLPLLLLLLLMMMMMMTAVEDDGMRSKLTIMSSTRQRFIGGGGGTMEGSWDVRSINNQSPVNTGITAASSYHFVT